MNAFSILITFLVVLAVYGGANFYIGHRLYRGLKLLIPRLGAWAVAVAYGAVALSLVLMFFPLPRALDDILFWFGSYWMGVFVYLFLSFLAVDLILLVGRLVRLVPSPAPKAVRLGSWLLAVVCAAGFTGYGIWHATQIYEVRYEVKLRDSAALAEPVKIVLISDLHLGAVRSESRLEEIVTRINRMKPDLVVMAGDIFNDDFHAIRNPERVREWFSRIEARYGVYAALGNHDGGDTFPLMLELLEAGNVRVLMDEYEIVDGRLAVIGRLDSAPIGGFGDLERRDISHLWAELDPALPRIVLDHRPSNIGEYGNNVDLILSGHTHKGQIFPANLITNLLFVVDYGHYQKDPGSPHVIVTSGVGT